jgi:hypothetical protein
MKLHIPYQIVVVFVAFVGYSSGEEPSATSAKRIALWDALNKVIPMEYQEIDVYAEDPGLTRILFRSKRGTFLFSLETNRVEHLRHQKLVPKVNRITYERGAGGSVFRLWYNGKRELDIGAGE